ncbi:transporter substrate-binding domain-containing protein [uncultured Marinobacter sp.]|uniref:substrate-binding periplasmic protein n=1 Tax=uncultured Marinobacter sp. TaxID=187379 RepID=UPI0030D70C40
MARYLLFIGILMISCCAHAQHRVLTVGYVDFPPYQFRDANGEPAGLFVELTRQVATEAGYRLEFLHLPTARVYYFLEIGAIDLWQGFANNPAVADSVLESRSRPLRVEYGVWHRSHVPGPEHFEDLKQRLLIRITGYNYAGLARFLDEAEDYRSTGTVNHNTAVEMLKRDRGDYVLGYREPMLEALKLNPVDDVLYVPMWVREAAWLFSIAGGDASRWRQAFDDAWQSLAEKGQLEPLPKLDDHRLMEGFPL